MVQPKTKTKTETRAGGNILIVDSDDLVAGLLERRLQKEGYSVTRVKDGKQAEQLLREGDFGLMIMEMILPGKNGFEILEDISNDEELSQIPVWGLSNLGVESDVQRAEYLGAEKYFIKDRIDVHDLISEVKEFFG